MVKDDINSKNEKMQNCHFFFSFRLYLIPGKFEEKSKENKIKKKNRKERKNKEK